MHSPRRVDGMNVSTFRLIHTATPSMAPRAIRFLSVSHPDLTRCQNIFSFRVYSTLGVPVGRTLYLMPLVCMRESQVVMISRHDVNPTPPSV